MGVSLGRSCATASVLMLAGVAGACAQAGQPPELGWLAGCWEAQRGSLLIEEQWLAPRGGMLLGMSRTARGDSVLEYEYMRIYPRSGVLVFAASPSGQTPAEFPLASAAAGEVTFENRTHDFPQRIRYRQVGGDSLVAEVAGPGGEGERTLVFRYVRRACSTGK